MNKKELLENYLEILDEKRRNNEKNIKSANKDAIEGEGTMQSRYDTKKEEGQAMEEAYRKKGEQILNIISEVKKIFYIIEKNNSINISKLSSLIKVLDIEEDKEKIYFLVPGGGLEKIGDILYLGIETPLGKQLIGKKVNEEYEIKLPKGSIDIEVLEIY